MNSVPLIGKNVYTLGPTAAGVKLHAISSRGMTFIPFEFSREELDAAIKGKPLWAVFRGTHIPEMILVVGDKEMVVPHNVQMDMLSEDSDSSWHKEVVEKKRQQDVVVNRVLYGVYALALALGICLALFLARYFGLLV